MTTAPQTASAIGNDERSDKTDDNGDRLCVLFFAMNGAGAGHAERRITSTAVTGIGPGNREPETG